MKLGDGKHSNSAENAHQTYSDKFLIVLSEIITKGHEDQIFEVNYCLASNLLGYE
jgi:hypothetical protein